MSGGYFDYVQYRLNDIACSIEKLIENNDITTQDEWGDKIGKGFAPETITEFKRALVIMQKASIYLHRIDWLVSGDTGEESFHHRLAEDFKEALCKWK
jgi:hypothetical protein